MSRDIKWEECKQTDTEETMTISRDLNEKDLVPGIAEFVKQNINPT